MYYNDVNKNCLQFLGEPVPALVPYFFVNIIITDTPVFSLTMGCISVILSILYRLLSYLSNDNAT